MAKISRSKLARGAKLLTKHVVDPPVLAQAELTGANIAADQMESAYAPFRINLSMPVLSSKTNTCQGRDGSPFHGIPFMLPPLQEHLSFTTSTRTGKSVTPSDSSPPIILDEVSFSFDQRLEPAAIVGNFDGSATAAPAGPAASPNGEISYVNKDRLVIEIGIMEKKPTWFDPAGTLSSNLRPGRTVWSGRIENIYLSDSYVRLNPWVASDINEVIDPMKSYIFVIMAASLGTATIDTALVSIEVSMRFLTKLTVRDSGPTIQNIPARHDGVPNDNLTHAAAGTTGAGINSSTSRALIGTTSAPGDPIVANDSGSATLGVQTMMAVIDEFERRKLHGGYKMDSDLPMLEELQESAAYSVLAVPLFNNVEFSGMAAREFASQPYITAGAANTFAIDRRYIPIEAPMTIHHILFTYNWMPFTIWDGANRQVIGQIANDSSSTITPALQLDIGVGIGTGIRGDTFDYQQVGKSTQLLNHLSATNWYGNAVDLVALGEQATLPFVNASSTIATARPWNLELYAMDLVGSGSPSLNGMTAQGKPVFVGRATSSTSSRRDIDGGASAVGGAEQWLEVRARLGDATNAYSQYDPNSMFLGSGGLWVYIIGKTHLV